MYEMAKKAREAMKGKAKRLSGEKDSKVDSSNWSPSEPLDADVKTGMRPISKRAYKKGGKVEGEKMEAHAGRKPRKSGGRAITADSLINRNQKDANEEREGKKHIGALKKGGRVGKDDGGIAGLLARNPVVGKMPARSEMVSRSARQAPVSDMSAADKARAAAAMNSMASERAAEARTEGERMNPINRKAGGKARKAGGKVNFGPMEMPDGKKGMSTSGQEALEHKQDAASKPTRGKAANYKKGGEVHEDEAEDKALIKKMVKPGARVGKFYGGAMGSPDQMPVAAPPAMPAPAMDAPMMPNMGDGKPMGLKNGGKAGKGKTHINIMINAGQKPPMPGMPPMPPGGPGGPGGVPVPMGMPPAGGAPPPMPMPMPMPGPAGPAGPPGMPPMGRKAGGKVYRSYKDMDAGAGSGLGRLEKTQIQKRKA